MDIHHLNKEFYNIEKNRLETFNNWNISFIDQKILALLGFYYIGIEDRVKCNFCGVEIYKWIEGDDILSEHLTHSPKCNLICHKNTDNIPIDIDILNKELDKNKRQQYISNNSVSEGSIESVNDDTNNRNIDIRSPDECGLGLNDQIPGYKKLSMIINRNNNDFNNSDENKKLSCSICFENSITHMIIPCNHASFCEECINKIHICPICRKQKINIARIYIQ